MSSKNIYYLTFNRHSEGYGGIPREKAAEDPEFDLHRTVYFDILNSLQINIAVLDAAGNIVFVNNAWKNFSVLNGQSINYDYLTINYLELCRNVFGQDRGSALAAYEGIKSVLDGKKGEFEFEYPCHSPEHKRWFLLHATPLKSGRPGAVISHMDITARKRKELAVYSGGIQPEDNGAVREFGIAHIGLNGQFLEVNETLCDMLGHEREEMLNLSIKDVIFDEDYNTLSDNIDQLLRTEQDGSTLNMRFVDYKGEINWISLRTRAHKNEIGQLQFLISEFHAIDNDKFSLNKYENIHSFTNNIIEGMEDAVYVKNLDGEYVFINKYGAALLGKPVGQILNTRCDEYFSKEESERIRGTDQQVINTHQTMTVEENHVIRSKKHTLLTTKGPMYDRDGSVVGVFGISEDISGRKETEKVLRDSAEDNKSYIKEIHHRVKNSLQLVSDLIDHGMEKVYDESAIDILKHSQDCIYSIAQVHRSLYQQEPQKEINLAAYIQNLVDNISKTYMRDDQNVNIIFELDQVTIAADKAKYFGLIITELLTNAFRHAFPGRESGVIELKMKMENEDYAYITVHDNGIGIFDKQSDNSSESRGLDLVELFTKQIDGLIELDKTEKGAKFKLLFKQSNLASAG